MAAVVILGIRLPSDRQGYITIQTLGGDTITVSERDIENSCLLSASGRQEDGERFFLNENAKVQIDVAAGKLGPISSYSETSTIFKSSDDGAGTITKYFDDGGTVSKSRDDLLSSEVSL